MNFNSLFQAFLDQFSPVAAFLAISSFLYVGFGRSKLFHFHPIPRLVLSVVLGLYSASTILSYGWSKIISVVATSVVIGLVALIVYNVALQRGKILQQYFSDSKSDDGSKTAKYQEILLKKLLGEVTK